MSDQENIVEQIWVNTAEAAEITGYNRQYVMKLAQKIFRQPEAEREVKIQRRPGYGYEFWLPDLIFYVEHLGHGPHARPSKKSG